MVDGWGTSVEDRVEDKFRDTLVKRARKRRVIVAGTGRFVVLGNEKLGDSYPSYTVTEDHPFHHCTCTDHAGGEYRRTCSHVVAVMLLKQDRPEYIEERLKARAERAETQTPPATTAQDGPETSGGQGGDRALRDRFNVKSPPAPGPDVDDLDGGVQSPGRVVVPDDPRDAQWGLPELPEKFSQLFPHQHDAVTDIIEAFERGAELVFVDAPTGSGKTLLGELARRLVNAGSRTVYTCSTKGLQDQFLHDFDYAKVIKGRRNYPTELAANQFPEITAEDCTRSDGEECNWCEVDCPYGKAKDEALMADLAVLNTSYALTAWNGPGTFSNRDLVIVDECDLLESALMGYAEVRVSERRIKDMGLGYPQYKTKPESWLEWVGTVIPKVSEAIGEIPAKGTDVRTRRRRRSLVQLRDDLRRLNVELQEEDARWVYQEERGAAVFRPVTVDRLANGVLWRHGKRWLLMSASIISPQEMVESLGFEGDWEIVSVPSTFPVENRPVRMMGVGPMTYKEKDKTTPKMKEAVTRIARHHPDERILVHTVSYALAKDIFFHLRSEVGKERAVITYQSGREREAMLRLYQDKDAAIMVAPSMDRGVDLPGHLCRVQVLCKVPFPNLKDEQVKARLYGTAGGQLWYSTQTARTIVQMTGRAVRSREDHAVTYILDSKFVSFWRKWKRLFPAWWSEAVDWSGKARRELKA